MTSQSHSSESSVQVLDIQDKDLDALSPVPNISGLSSTDM